jgi:hypothetical protein
VQNAEPTVGLILYSYWLLMPYSAVLFNADLQHSFEIRWETILIDRWRKMANCLNSINSNLSIVDYNINAYKYEYRVVVHKTTIE